MDVGEVLAVALQQISVQRVQQPQLLQAQLCLSNPQSQT